MHINNVSSETSLRGITWMVIICFLITAGFIVGYVNTSGTDLSFWGFFQWYWITFQAGLNSMTNEDWTIKAFWWMVFIVLPAGIYLGLISMLIARHNALTLQRALWSASEDLIPLAVDFLPGRIEFKFYSSQYNFACRYNEIKKLELVIKTELAHTRYGSYPVANEVELNFTLDNKKYTINNTPVNAMHFIYKVLDCARSIEKFSYKFSGAGSPTGMKEKIENYIKRGVTQILSTPQKNGFKMMSIILFTIGCFFIFAFKDSIPDMIGDSFIWVILTPALIFLGVSLIFDIFLVTDKIRERKFK